MPTIGKADRKIPKKTLTSALACGAIGTALPKTRPALHKKFRELIHGCFTEEEWMARFIKVSAEDQIRYRIALEPKEQQVSGQDGGPLEINIVKFADLKSEE